MSSQQNIRFIACAPHPDNENILLRFDVKMPYFSVDHLPNGVFIPVGIDWEGAAIIEGYSPFN